MTFKPAQCPNCGGALQLPDDRSSVNCMYCGVTIIVREAIQAAAVGNVTNWLHIADTAMQSGNYQEAYDFFTRVLEVKVDSADAWLGRAEAAGRLSTLQNFRLLEMISGIKKASELTSDDPRAARFLDRCPHFICSITSSYYLSMKAQLLNSHVVNFRDEYLNQLHKIIHVLEQGHVIFPTSQEIMNELIQVCGDNLQRSGVMFRNNATGQINYWHLPPNQKSWLDARSSYYKNELLALNPDAVREQPTQGFLESLPKIPVGAWIAIGVTVVIAISAVLQDQTGRSSGGGVETANRSRSASSVSQPKETADEYVSAAGRLWTGVQLYYGPSKSLVGEVLGGNSNYVDPISGQSFRGIKIRMIDGSSEWKDRDAVVSGQWFVKANDPAIRRAEWYEYQR